MEMDYNSFRRKDVKEIRKLLLKLSKKQKNEFKNIVLQKARQKISFKDETSRIALVKLLLAFLPETGYFIIELINKRKSDTDYEIHFSIFCFIDQIKSFRTSNNFKQKVPGIIENYLLSVKKDTAQAAWMAGELLGAHWDKQTSLKALDYIYTNAKYEEGKKAALYGLYQLYKTQKDIRGLKRLENILNETKQKAIKDYLTFLLER